MGSACGASSPTSRPVWTQRADQRHQPSGHNRHSEMSLLSNRKPIREPSGCSRGDMAALPWWDCGVWAALGRRKEEAVGGCPSDAWSLFTKRGLCLWPSCSWCLSRGSKATSTRAHPGVSSSSGHCNCSCHHEKLSLSMVSLCLDLYTPFRVQWVSCSEKNV